MEPTTATMMDQLTALVERAEVFALGLLRPWQLYQLGIILGCFLVAEVLSRWLGPRMHSWMRTLEGWPKWRLRVLLVVYRRLRLIFLVATLLTTVTIMREVTWPSRSYLVGIAASLSMGWLGVVLAARLIRNNALRTLVRWGLWIWVTLFILGLTEEAAVVLDSAAIEFGEFRLSALAIVKALLVTGILFVCARFISHSLGGRIRQVDEMSPSMQVLSTKALQIALYGGAFFIGLKAVGFDLTGLAVLSGAIGLGLGFGLQKVVSNLVSGIIILLDKSIKPGDVISLGETFGWINALGARYVSVVTRDGKEYLIPNEDLITGQVVNWSHSNEFVRLDIYFGTAYGDDPHAVRRIAIEAAKSVDRVLSMRPPVCHIVGFGDSSVDYILRFWITDPTGGLTNIRGNVYLALWDAFQANGVSIPFPQREVKLLNSAGPKEGPTPDSANSATPADPA